MKEQLKITEINYKNQITLLKNEIDNFQNKLNQSKENENLLYTKIKQLEEINQKFQLGNIENLMEKNQLKEYYVCLKYYFFF